jgi:hypothetical protein
MQMRRQDHEQRGKIVNILSVPNITKQANLAFALAFIRVSLLLYFAIRVLTFVRSNLDVAKAKTKRM